MASRPARDPFAAVPHIAPGVEALRDAGGRLQIGRPLPEAAGWRDWLARKCGLRRVKRVDLDERGARFWDLVDGQRSLGEIAQALRRETKMGEKEARGAVMEFTKALMLRRLIGIEVAQSEAAPQTRRNGR